MLIPTWEKDEIRDKDFPVKRQPGWVQSSAPWRQSKFCYKNPTLNEIALGPAANVCSYQLHGIMNNNKSDER